MTGSPQEPDLEFVEGVERVAAALERMPAPLGRILDSLQGNQRVDAADRPQGAGAPAAVRPSPSLTVKVPAGARRAAAAAGAARARWVP